MHCIPNAEASNGFAKHFIFFMTKKKVSWPNQEVVKTNLNFGYSP